MQREGATRGERTDIQKAAIRRGNRLPARRDPRASFPASRRTSATSTFATDESKAELLGLFQVSILHNLVHALFGVAGLIAAKSWAASKNYFIWGGVVYLILWIYGLIIDDDSKANFIPVNVNDNWLHFVLGVAMIAAGYLLSRRVVASRAATT